MEVVDNNLETVPPFKWMGEAGCIVGPFKTKMVAEFFAEYIMLSPQSSSPLDCLFKQDDQWFIDARLAPPTGSRDSSANYSR